MVVLPLLLSMLALGAPAPVAALDPCAVITKAEAAALLGAAVTMVMPEGARIDEDTGGERTICTYMAGKRGLVVSVVTFKSAAEARSKLTKEMVSERMNADGEAKLEEESGLGDHAYFATTATGATYIVLRGAKVLGVAMGGEDMTVTVASRAALRKSVSGALARL